MSAYMSDLGMIPKYKMKKDEFKRLHRNCAACARLTKRKDRTVDHIVPMNVFNGSAWDKSNWQMLCSRCHANKTSKENKLMFRVNSMRIVVAATRP